MKRCLIFLFAVCFAFTASAATLKPENAEQFFVQPETETTFRFNTVDGETPDITGTAILSAAGEPVSTAIKTAVNSKTISVSGTFPQGFWEIQFPNKQTFGIISLPAFEGTRDNFFAIDAALSWLVGDDNLREGLIKAARRSGIVMLRERVQWDGIEKNEGTFDWQTHRNYDKVRQCCKANGIEVLELFHDAPEWTNKIEVYPGNLIKTAKSWQTVAEKWHSAWGALEIWNEPEIFFGAELPSDQYVPAVKAVSFQYKKAGIKTPLFGGVMAHFQKRWLKTAAENGLLDAVDGFSFHTYGTAPSMEKLVADYRNYLTESGFESMPLWLTECGRPWKRGTERPNAEQDAVSAADIVMKGVESRCCGVDRYFPFVYPYYDENDNNFGMMDKTGSPCRSMAGYVQLIQTLSGTKYIGDLKTDEPAIQRARLFKNAKNETVAVLYTTALNEPKQYQIPGKVKYIEALTGEPLNLTDSKLKLESARLYYVHFDGDVPANFVQKDTAAMKIYQQAKKPFQTNSGQQKPLVMRFEFDKNIVSAKPDGYTLTKTDIEELPLKIKLFNLGNTELKGTLTLQTSRQQTPFTVPAQGFADTVFNVPVKSLGLETGEWKQVKITAAHREEKLGSLVFYLRGQATLNGVLSTVKRTTPLPVSDVSRWQQNAPNYCDLTMTAQNGVWQMSAVFTGDGDRWVYPRFELPEGTDLTAYNGLLTEIRVIGKITPRCFLFEKNGAGYIADLAVRSDEWTVLKLPFDVFGYSTATAPDANNQLDLNEVPVVSIGGNTVETTGKIEVRKLFLYAD
ncbi:MAG: hypothetical protein LBN39_06160 [Planctomycetaceae bacterium]|jgi:hypothetical protein|nr:hypothetical protein [Planctomycetaceae bacterium]